MPASKAQRAATAKRRAQAVAMRMAGLDYQTIADRLEYKTRQAAAKDVERALAANLAEVTRTAEEFREVERMRLERLQAAAWQAAVGGDLKAIETCLRIIDRRCKLLGLDAPQRHEVLTLDALDAEIQRLEKELGKGGRAPVPVDLGD